MSPWLLADINFQHPSLWTEQVRSRQNNRTRASCEFHWPLFLLTGVDAGLEHDLLAHVVYRCPSLLRTDRGL